MSTTSKPSDGHHTQDERLFFLASEYRRALYWAIGGLVLLAPIAWYIGIHIQRRGPVDTAVSVCILLGIAIWLSQFLLTRIRIDHAGVGRRFLWMWDLWSWDEFQSGTVQGGRSQHEFLTPHRYWWKQKLNFELLDEGDRKAVSASISSVWVQPVPSRVPEVLTLSMKWPDRHRVHLSADGVEILNKREKRSYRWADAVSLTIWRVEKQRQDFRELILTLPDEDVRLIRVRTPHGGQSQNWKGPPSDEIDAFIRSVVTPEKLRDFSLSGEANSIEELDARYAQLNLKDKEFTTVLKWNCRFWWGLTALIPLMLPFPDFLPMLLMNMFMAGAFQWWFIGQKQTASKHLREYETERRSFETRLVSDTEPALRPPHGS